VPADHDAAPVREVPEAIKEAAERIFQAAYGSGALARRGLLLVAKDELLAAFAAGQRSASEAQPAAAREAVLYAPDGTCACHDPHHWCLSCNAPVHTSHAAARGTVDVEALVAHVYDVLAEANDGDVLTLTERAIRAYFARPKEPASD
jgi:hypothetical protein